ncbi:sensor histidine kinase [Nibrella saemangeumensis]|uniref:histidine kinase n=2 Tax=Nibrella saemangeumensis TaxID=1084526 RepID=A0ABP8NRA0_9BACT
MMQDRQGFIWFATQDGINKYDGYTMTLYQNDPRDTNSLGDNNAMAVFEDHTGLIWIGTGGGGGVNSFNPETGVWKRYPHHPNNPNSMGKGAIEGIAEDNNGVLWFGSTDGLTSYDPQKNLFHQYVHKPEDKSSLVNNRVFSICKDEKGRLWIGTGDGLDLYNPGENSFIHITGDAKDSVALKNSIVHHIFKDNKGQIWLSTLNHGLIVLDPDTRKCIKHFYDNPEDANDLGNNFIYTTTQDKTGNFWISASNGLFRHDPLTGQFTLYKDKEFLPELETLGHCILVDNAGLVWLGTTGRGAVYFSPIQRKFYRYLHEATSLFGSGSNQIAAILKSQKNLVYILTNRNLLQFQPQKKELTLLYEPDNIKNDKSDSYFAAACEEKPGVFWLGTSQHGIIQFDSHTGKVINFKNDPKDPSSIASNNVDVLFKDRNNTIWVGTDGGNLQYYDGKQKKFIRYDFHLKKRNAEFYPGIRFIYEDKEGMLWVAIHSGFFSTGGGGLYRIDRKKRMVVHYYYKPNDPHSLSNNSATCIYEDQQGFIWLGTYGSGLNKLNPKTGKFTTYTKGNGLQSNTIHAISGDKAGNVWILAKEGITRLNTQTLQTTRFTYTDGLAGSPSGVLIAGFQTGNATLQDPTDGTIYFGSNNGFTVFHPDRIQQNRYKPAVAITQFKVKDHPYPITGKEITLSYDKNFFDIDFVALSFLSATKNQYAYQLAGLDADWIYNGTGRTARYTDVKHGTYTFRVKAANSDGVWNEQGASIKVVVLPPWWYTWWAYTIYAILFAGGIWSYIQYRSRELRRENRRLEDKVAARTEQIQHQKEEIESQRDNLEQTLAELKTTQAQLIQKEKMASLGELTAGIAHEIQNPLNFVNNLAEVSTELVEELEEEIRAGRAEDALEITEDLRETLEKVNHHGKRADSIVKGMLQHSRTSSGEKQPTDLNALADEYLRLAYQGLRAKDKTFNADLRLNLDPNLGQVAMAPQEIGRVLLNLYNNAFYATQQKAKLADHDYQPQIEITTHAQDCKVALRVKDNGTGIPEEILNKIYQPFFTTKPTGQGTGLGLSLSYDIVTKGHNGEMKVESQEGLGTEFSIYLPVTG